MRKLILFAFLLIASVAHAEEQVMSWSYPTGSGVWTVSMSSDGKYIAAGSYDNHVYFFDSAGKLLWKYKTDDTVWTVAVSPDSKFAAAGSKDRNIYFFDSAGKLLWNYKTGDTVWTVSMSSDGKYIAAGSYDNNVYFFDSTGKLLWKYKTGDIVLSTSLSSDGKYIAAGSYDNSIYLLDSAGSLRWKYKAFDIVLSTSLSSDGEYLAAGSYDNHVYFFDSAGKLLWKYKASDEIWDVAMSSRGEYVVAGSRDSNVYFFNSSGNLLSKYKTAYYVSSVATSEDGNYTVAGSYDNNAYFFKKIQPVVEVPKLPKLIAAKSVANPIVVEGDSTAVDIKIQNLGEGKATKVHFKDSIPEGLELAEGSTEWSGELKAGESMVILYKLRAQKLAKPENATYQLPKLEVTYEDASLNIYTATVAPIFITVVPKEVEPVKPAPSISLYALIAVVLPYVAGILLVVGAVLVGRKLRRIVTKERVLYALASLKSASAAVSEKTAKIAVEGRSWLKNLSPSFILRIKGTLEGEELRELRGIYLSLPYKTKNPRELLGVSTAAISGVGAYEMRLRNAGFATIRDLAGADVSEVAERTGLSEAYADFLVSASKKIAHASGELVEIAAGESDFRTYLGLPYKTKNPRELLGMSAAVISGVGAYERRLAGAGFATIRDLACADVSEVAERTGLSEAYADFLVSASKKIAHASGELAEEEEP